MSREHNCRKRIFDCARSPVANGNKLSNPSFEKFMFLSHAQHNSVKESDSHEKKFEALSSKQFRKYRQSFTVGTFVNLITTIDIHCSEGTGLKIYFHF